MQVTEAPVSTKPRTGIPSTVSWPEMGGPTAHPIGATLALGDPPRSLNAPEESFSYLLGRGAPGFFPWVGLEQFPVLVVATSRRSPIWLSPLSTKIRSLFTIIKVWRATRVIQGWLCRSQGW